MGKMVTKTKRVDGNLWYYRADADEPDEKYEPPLPSMTDYEREQILESLAVTPSSTWINSGIQCVQNNIDISNAVAASMNWISASAPELLRSPTTADLHQYLVFLQMDFVMNPIDINMYANHIIYNGHDVYYYIEPQPCYVTRNEFYLTARAIEIKDGEFVVKKSPTMRIFSSGSYNISREPFDIRYPIRWEK